MKARSKMAALLTGAVFVASPALGAAPRPPATATRPASAASAPAPASFVPARKEFAPVPEDPIERAEFQTKARPIRKSLTSATALMVREGRDGSMMGLTSDVIATVPAETRTGGAGTAILFAKQAEIGEEMKVSFDEAVRAVKMRYPKWEGGRIEISFGDKYTPHDGGSAGTCFATMLLSMLEGFNLDPKCAVTGDISVNWKVRKIGGVFAKLHGAAADGCLYAGIPDENAAQLSDMALMFGDASLRDIQVFSMVTLQDAVALLRTDRAPQLVQAMKEFTDLQPKMKNGRVDLAKPDVQKALEQILVYAPNHESAKLLLQIGRGTAPKTLSQLFTLYQIMIVTYPYRHIIEEGQTITRETVSDAMTTAARKQLGQIRPYAPKELVPLLTDATAIVETSNSIALKQAQQKVIDARRESFVTHYKALGSNKELVEKMMRQGF